MNFSMPLINTELTGFEATCLHMNIKQVTFHGLRHTHITHLLMDNVPINVVAERAGHAKVSHTLDLYGHVLPHMQEGAALLIDQELTKALREHERNGN